MSRSLGLAAPIALGLVFAVASGGACASSTGDAPGSSGDEGGSGPAAAGSGAGGSGGSGTTSSVATGAGGGTTTAGTGGAGGGGETCSPGAPDEGGTMPICGVVIHPPAGAEIGLTLTVLDFSNQAAVPGLTVKACARADELCASPLKASNTDSDGKVFMLLPTGANGFDGYLEIGGGQAIPELLFTSVPLTADSSYTTYVATQATLGLVSTVFGVEIDPTRGAIAAVLSDCADAGAGLTMWVEKADSCSLVGYAENNLPSQAAVATDASGLAFALNVPPGKTKLVSRVGATKELLGTTEVLVRPTQLTAVAFVPTP